MKLLTKFITCALLCYAGCSLAAQLTEAEQQAKQQGKVLWDQKKRYEAIKQLLSPAQAGDEESQYLLAESLSRSLSRFPEEYKDNAYWYEAAANQGNIYAMYRLNKLCSFFPKLAQCHNSKDYWSKAAMEVLKPKLAANNAEAFYQHYIFTRDINDLKKAAEGNFPEAQYRYGEYFTRQQNQSNAIKWYQKAANNGDIKAIFNLSSYYAHNNKQPKKANKYLLMAVNKGYINAIEIHQMALSTVDDDFNKDYDISNNPIQSYAYATLLEPIDKLRFAIRHQPDFTPEQLKEAKEFAEQWKKDHPPLSYYQSPVFNGSNDN